MSIKIISLDKNNKLYKDIDDISSFTEVLVSNHKDTIENATDEFISKLYLLQDKFYYLKNLIYRVHDIKILCGSGYRTEKINELIGGSKTSQHKDAKAIDIHFFNEYNNRIRGHKNLYKFRDTIDMVLGDNIIQMFVYDWGIHIGFATTKRVISFRRGDR